MIQLTNNAILTLSKRYFLKDKEGNCIEDWNGLCTRVAHFIACDEKKELIKEWEDKYFDLIYNLRFLPNTPTLMNAGKQDGQLAACFVLPLKDDMRSIMETLTNTVLIHKSGGGTGFDFSPLRPKNSRVSTTTGTASGPISFMRMFNGVTQEVKQGGTRRGANMGILRCLGGKTRVNTINGKIPIENLEGKEEYIYTYNEKDKSVKVSKAKFYKSDFNREIYKVTLDNDNEIYCTNDHLFLKSNGEYVALRDLTTTSSLMALHKSIDNQGYSCVAITGDNSMKMEHILVAEMKLGRELNTLTNNGDRGKEDEIVHHINGITFDNNPQNIKVMFLSDHAKLHSRNLLQNQLEIARKRKNRTLEEVYGKEKADSWKKKMSISAKNRESNFKNHKIKKIEFYSIEDVFDATVEDTHNFVVEDVFVHNCDHPDILEFIDCKRKLGEFNNFNISVAITDKFLEAVSKRTTYQLIDPRDNSVFGELKALDVFNKIIENAHATGEPGVFFVDTANRDNLLDKYTATNPCGEQPLLPYEACNLGSLNLSVYVKEDKTFNWDKFAKDVNIATRFLDSVVSSNQYPIDRIKETHFQSRKIGLGVMGLADAFIEMGIVYGSEESYNLASKIYSTLNDVSKETSEELGKEKGYFPLSDKTKIKRRNMFTTTIAPTGSISIIAGCSSGIEPIFKVGYIRNVLDGEKLKEFHYIFKNMMGDKLTSELEDEIIQGNSIQNFSSIPNKIKKLFIVAEDLSVEQHVKMQAVFQKYSDSGVSKTINMNKNATKEDVEKAFILAYNMGCKGITVYRDGSRADQPMASSVDEPLDRKKFNRTKVLSGTTEKIETPLGSLLLTINNHSQGQPGEVIINVSKSGLDANGFSEAIGRLLSIGLQHGIPPHRLGSQLRGIQGEEFIFHDGKKYTSILDLIGARLCGTMNKEKSFAPCPSCGEKMYKAEGCSTCLSCGYSKC